MEVMISLLCERRAPLTEFISDLEKTKNYLAVLLEASYTKAIAVLTKECIIFTKKLQVHENEGLIVPLRTSDCETIFSFLFLRGLEETSQSLEPRLW